MSGIQIRQRKGRTPLGNPCCPACGIKHATAPEVCAHCLESARMILRLGLWKEGAPADWLEAWRPAVEAITS